MSIRVMQLVFDSAIPGMANRFAAAMIADACDHSGVGWISAEEIARKAGMSLPTARRAIAFLRAEKWVAVVTRGHRGKANVYQFDLSKLGSNGITVISSQIDTVSQRDGDGITVIPSMVSQRYDDGITVIPHPSYPSMIRPDPSDAHARDVHATFTLDTPAGPVQKKEGGRKKRAKLAEPTFPPGTAEPWQAEVARWFRHKKENGGGYTAEGWAILVRKLAAFPAAVVRQAVDDSIERDWQGLFPERVAERLAQDTGRPVRGGVPESGPQAVAAALAEKVPAKEPAWPWREAFAAVYGCEPPEWAMTTDDMRRDCLQWHAAREKGGAAV